MSVPILPSNWNYEPLKFHSSFSKGLSIQKSDLTDEGVAVISYGQIHAKSNSGVHLTDDLIRYVPRKLTLHGTTAKLCCGDLIYADTSEDVRGIGNAVFIDNSNEVFAGYHTLICHPDGTTLLGHYLAFLSQSDWWRAQLRSIAMGVKVFSITQSVMSRVWVPLPPINEQKKIVVELSLICNAIDESIQSIENQISVLERYRTSVIHEAVTKGLGFNEPMKSSGVDWIGDIPDGWSINKIKNVSVLRTGRTPDSFEYNRYYNGDINWFTPADLNDNSVGLAQKSITRQAIKDGQAFIVPKNSVLVVGIGTVGKVGFLTVDASTNQQITSLVPNRKIMGRFLFYVIRDMKKIFNNLALYTTLPILNNQYIGNQIIPLPPIKVQKAIANYLDTHIEAIDLVLEAKYKQIGTLRQHRQSLIYEYVTGQRSVGKED